VGGWVVGWLGGGRMTGWVAWGNDGWCGWCHVYITPKLTPSTRVQIFFGALFKFIVNYVRREIILNFNQLKCSLKVLDINKKITLRRIDSKY